MARREQPFLASSTALSCVVVIGLLLIGFLPLNLTPHGMGTTDRPPSENSDPQLHEDAATVSNSNWTEAEIVRGREECMHLLQSVAADVEMLAPIKKADCGLPAPVRVKSIGSSSKVVFEPPVDINCRLMAALYRWNKNTLQPAARYKLGTSVTQIAGGSGYSCRNVYNLPGGNLSQHAFGNAIDIAAFELEDGRSVTVLKGWGPTAADIRAQAKEKSESVRSHSALVTWKTDRTAAPNQSPAIKGLTRASISHKMPLEQKLKPSAALPAGPESGVGALKPTIASEFLNKLHQGACREFETALGPEANEAHRSHFHFDLTPLRGHAYCE